MTPDLQLQIFLGVLTGVIALGYVYFVVLKHR